MRAVDVKSLMLKSAFIENLDRSIELTNEYINNTESSVIYRIQNFRNRKKREELRAQNADVMLVKSGGVLVKELAFECAKKHSKGLSIKDACLQAHKSILNADDERLKKLQTFWELREI